MKKGNIRVLFFAHDPGGVNVLLPLIKSIDRKKYYIDVYGRNESRCLFEKAGIDYKVLPDKYVDEDSLEDLLVKNSIEVVVTGTSANDFTEKYLWKAASNRGILSIAVLDAWINYGIRFSKWGQRDSDKYDKDADITYIPSVICVMDELSKRELIRVGIPELRIIVTGQPYLECLAKTLESVSKREIKKCRERILGTSSNKKIILYASDNISSSFNDKEHELYFGYNEKTIFEELNILLKDRASEDFVLIIRPHPKENIEYWKSRIEHEKSYKVIIDKEIPLGIILNSADIVISMMSMILIEAALINKPILSVQIGLKGGDPFYLSQIGVTETIVSREVFSKKMDDFFDGNSSISSWNITNRKATESILKIMEERLCQN